LNTRCKISLFGGLEEVIVNYLTGDSANNAFQIDLAGKFLFQCIDSPLFIATWDEFPNDCRLMKALMNSKVILEKDMLEDLSPLSDMRG
jgi:hypothetical protein